SSPAMHTAPIALNTLSLHAALPISVVSGPSRLHGERVDSPDIRAGMAMLIAALCAEGTTEIGNVRQIDRGYERIDEHGHAGADVDRKSTRLNSSHRTISYAVFCLKI